MRLATMTLIVLFVGGCSISTKVAREGHSRATDIRNAAIANSIHNLRKQAFQMITVDLANAMAMSDDELPEAYPTIAKALEKAAKSGKTKASPDVMRNAVVGALIQGLRQSLKAVRSWEKAYLIANWIDSVTVGRKLESQRSFLTALENYVNEIKAPAEISEPPPVRRPSPQAGGSSPPAARQAALPGDSSGTKGVNLNENRVSE